MLEMLHPLRHQCGFAKAKALRWLRTSLSRHRNISLIGWYGHRSTGDDVIADCIRRLVESRASLLDMRVNWTSDCDADIGVIGGGTIIGCDTSSICDRADRIPGPLAILGPGFRNTGDSDCRAWQPRMKKLFDRAVGAGVRGPLTAKALCDYGMATNAAVVGDPAVWFESTDVTVPVSGPTIGVCIRRMRSDGLEERYTTADDTYRRFADVLLELLQALNATPVFISFAENEFDSDTIGAERLKAMLPSPYRTAPLIPYTDDVRHNMSVLGKLDYVFSERMHPGIIAWVLGKPCILIENQFNKSMDFMASIGMNRFCVRSDELTIGNFMPRLKELLTTRQECSAKAASCFASQRTLQARLVDTFIAAGLRSRASY